MVIDSFNSILKRAYMLSHIFKNPVSIWISEIDHLLEPSSISCEGSVFLFNQGVQAMQVLISSTLQASRSPIASLCTDSHSFDRCVDQHLSLVDVRINFALDIFCFK